MIHRPKCVVCQAECANPRIIREKDSDLEKLDKGIEWQRTRVFIQCETGWCLQWALRCPKHVTDECLSCGRTTPGNGISVKWVNAHRIHAIHPAFESTPSSEAYTCVFGRTCNACSIEQSKKRCCDICMDSVYRMDPENDWIPCARPECQHGVHAMCWLHVTGKWYVIVDLPR